MKSASVLLLFLVSFSVLSQEEGKAVYDKYCTQCHGDQGDGQGVAEPFVLPKPRDFTSGVFKFRSTGSGFLPLEKDLEKVVREGIHGTSMPAFAHIGEASIKSVVAYIQTFYQERKDRDKEDGFWPPKEFKVGNPPKVTPELVAKGKQLYLQNGCGDCHGFAGKADGPSSPTLEDDYGNPIRPANLTQSWRFRAGNKLENIYLAFSTGISGTPMPSYADSLDDDARWALAAYVHSLSEPSEPDASPQAIAGQVSELPNDFDSELWNEAVPAYFPITAQVIWEPINTDPTVNGVTVRAVHDGETLALLLSWDDPTFSQATEKEESFDDFFAEEETVTVLNDQFAVQFPSGLPKDNERPYFLKGDGSNPVNLWHWTNSGSLETVAFSGAEDDPWAKYYQEFQGDAVLENRLAKGRDQVAALDQGTPLEGKVRYKNGTYQLLIKRPLSGTDGKEVQMVTGQFIPIAFWAWDGHNKEEGLKASLSSWYLLMLEQPVESGVYYKTVAAVLLVLLFQWMAMRAARKKSRLEREAEADGQLPQPATAE